MQIIPACGKIGDSWIKAIQDIVQNNERFLRGLYYYNDGMVRQIYVANNQIIAKVRGVNSGFYESRFSFKPLNSNTISQIKKIISDNPELALEISEGILSESFFEILEQEGLSIFPESLSDIDSFCSCPDYTNPCKHLYASFVAFTREIEKRPLIYLHLIGIYLKDILALSCISDILEEKKENNPFNKLVSSDNIDLGTFKAENYLLIKDNLSLPIPNIDVEKLFFPLKSHPPFYKIGEFKGLLKKIHCSLTEDVGSITKNIHHTTYKDSDFYFYYDENEVLKAFITPSTQFLYYLRSKGSRVQFKNEFLQTPILTSNKIEFSKKEGIAVSLDIIFDYFLEINDELFEGNNSFSARFLGFTKNLAISLVKSSSFQPELVIDNNDTYFIRYIPVINNDIAKSLLDFYKSLMPPTLLFKENSNLVLSNNDADKVLSLFLTHIIHKIVFLNQGKHKNQVIINLFIKNRSIKVCTEEEKNTVRNIANWLESIAIKSKKISFVIRIESLQSSEDDDEYSFFMHIDVVNKENPLDYILSLSRVFEDEDETIFGMPAEQVKVDLIKQIKLAATFMPVLGDILSMKGQLIPKIDIKSLLDLMSNTSEFLNNLGIKIIIPKELKNIVSPKLMLKAKHKKTSGVSLGENISQLSLDDLMNFSYEIAIGDVTISGDEFKKLVSSADEIVKYKGKYLFLKPDEINSILEKINNLSPKFSSNLEFLHSALTSTFDNVKFNYDETIRKALEDVTNVDDVNIPEGLDATLRPYQVRGFRWLYSNLIKGFGSCIADDMGLGKTIQVIALILKLKEENKLSNCALVVCPTTLVGNWIKECKRFAPDLNVSMYHGVERKLEHENADILITTYGLLRQDLKKFKAKEWDILVIDEAQNIKNNDTGQTIAVKSINAKNYIAMSGTPVENRLTELWSIFDFINKGYMGSISDFQRKYSLPIEKYRDEDKINKLKLATSPFVLRRLKSDKSIIDDLPDKIVFDEYCYLTKEQAALYEKVLESTMKTIEQSEGINRRGNILKLITSLKQICNHPAHFTKKDKLAKELSGKTEKVFSVLDNIISQNEKALIFTQYKEMGELLVEMVKSELAQKPLFFHGSIPRNKRDQIIESFQSDEDVKLMIVSLKAGGTGLNLTAATNVVHYDLWWNPAVEDQATDRAYRIGQDKNVIVHRMITLGTFEEKIDEIIKSKKELADLTISTGERWITELSNRDLKEIFSLSNF